MVPFIPHFAGFELLRGNAVPLILSGQWKGMPVAACQAAITGLRNVGLKIHQVLGSIQRKLDSVVQSGASPLDHRHVRLFAIQCQLEQIGQSFDAVVGDSLVEGAVLRPVCGRPILNAGIGGATVSLVTDGILPLLKQAPPSVLVIAIGVNDSGTSILRPRATRADIFATEYRVMVASAKSIASTVVVATIAPVERGKTMGDGFFDTELMNQFNQIIRTVAAEKSVPVIDLSVMADDSGLARPGMTSDGVHLTGVGYEVWRRAIEAGWIAAMDGGSS